MAVGIIVDDAHKFSEMRQRVDPVGDVGAAVLLNIAQHLDPRLTVAFECEIDWLGRQIRDGAHLCAIKDLETQDKINTAPTLEDAHTERRIEISEALEPLALRLHQSLQGVEELDGRKPNLHAHSQRSILDKRDSTEAASHRQANSRQPRDRLIRCDGNGYDFVSAACRP